MSLQQLCNNCCLISLKAAIHVNRKFTIANFALPAPFR
jgi:hypothetical protein